MYNFTFGLTYQFHIQFHIYLHNRFGIQLLIHILFYFDVQFHIWFHIHLRNKFDFNYTFKYHFTLMNNFIFGSTFIYIINYRATMSNYNKVALELLRVELRYVGFWQLFYLLSSKITWKQAGTKLDRTQLKQELALGFTRFKI